MMSFETQNSAGGKSDAMTLEYQSQNDDQAPGLPHETQHRRHIAKSREAVAPTAPELGSIVHSLNHTGRGGSFASALEGTHRGTQSKGRTPESESNQFKANRAKLPRTALG